MDSNPSTGAGLKKPGVIASEFHKAFYGPDPRKERKMKDRELRKLAPNFQHLVYGKRYILPEYRQVDYYPQEWCNMLYSGAVLDPMALGKVADDVTNCALTNALQAMKCGRPQLWLERELAERLMLSDLPGDFEAADIKWRWPGLRIHVPKEILRIVPKEGVEEHDLMFFDICHVPVGKVFGIPEPYLSEITAMGHDYGWRTKTSAIVNLKTVEYAETAMMLSGNISGRDINAIDWFRRGDFMLYGVVKQFDDVTLREVAQVTSSDTHLSSPYQPTEDDDKFCAQMLHLALQCLLFLGSMPLEYQPEEVLRKARTEGKHALPALLRAKFVGQSQLRAAPAHSAQPVHHTGRLLPAHWRRGHWKRQVFGQGRAERKLIWIKPYQTFGPEEELEATHA